MTQSNAPPLGDEWFRSIVEQTREGIAWVTPDGRIAYANPPLAAMLGWQREDLVGTSALDLMEKNDHAVARHKLGERKRGVAEKYEFRLRRRDGSPIWVSISSTPIYDSGEAYAGALAMISDLTEQKRAEEIHSHEQRLLRRIAGDAPLQEVLDDLCRTLQSLASRPLRCAALLADTRNNLLTCLSAPTLPEDFRRDGSRAMLTGSTACARAVRTRQPVIITDIEEPGLAEEVLALRRKHGYRAVWSYPILQDESVLGTLAFLPDQTGTPAAEDGRLIEFGIQVARLALVHEHAKRALRESEARFRDYAEMSADWYWEQDAEFRFTEITYGPDSRLPLPIHRDRSIIGRQRWDLPFVNVPEGFWEEHRRLLAAGKPYSNLHLQYREADGSIRHGVISGRPLFDEQGNIAGYRGVGRDITARVTAEEKTAEAREWLQLAVRAAHVGLWERDADTWEFRFTNDWKAQFGYAADEIEDTAEQFDRLVHPDDLERIHAVARAYAANPEDDYENEFRLRHKDGTWRWVLSRGALITDAATGRRRWMGCHVDITEHKQLLEALGRSERNYRQLLQNNPLPVWIFDAENLQFLEASQGVCDLTGFSREELLARKVVDMRPPEERELFLESFCRAGLKGRGDIGLWHTVKKDGSSIATRIAWGGVDYAGRPAIIVFLQDVTEQARAEKALRASEAALNEAQRLAQIGSWEFDLVDGGLTWSDEVFRIFETDPARFGPSYESFLAMVHPDDRDMVDAAYTKSVSDRSPYNIVLRLLLPDGRIKFAHARCETQYDPAGYPLRSIGTAQDITARWRAEEQVRELNATLENRVKARTAELEAANHELDAFNYSVSHDLRAPLRSAYGFSHALLEEYAQHLDDTGRDYLQRVCAAAQRMDGLIDAMYHLSKLSRSLLQIRELDLSANAQSVIEEFRQSDPARRIEVVIEPGIKVEGDPGLLRVVLTNLLGNAWKYTARTANARIELGATLGDQGNAIYFVRDNGAGFDMQFSDKLFMLFQRLHREEEFEGHGVGLATVQRIVRRHGGRIWAKSEKGQGSTFFFTLWEDAAIRREAEMEFQQRRA